MWFKNIFILFFFSIFVSEFAYAQQTHAKKDSTQLYENIQTYSKRSKFATFIYRLAFKPVATKSLKKKIKKKVYKNLIQNPYSTFEGKTIRHINIETLDPFGYSIADNIKKPQNFFSNTGNKLHIKTQPVTIRNLLLIRQNQTFDSLLVKESERLVRSMGYVHDVSFSVIATSENSDSVDIFIRELDYWSIIPKVNVSSSHININLTDKNFAGLGHESQNGFTWYQNNGDYSYNLNYFIPNIRNTYINSTLHYDMHQFNNFTRSFSVDRPFFSPFTKWAAGLSFMQQFRKDYIHTGDSLLLLQRFKFNTQDYWAGNAIRIFKGNKENSRTTNFISAIRILRIRYFEKQIDMFEIQPEFSDEDFYMASIGISTRNYVQDKFIFKYDIIEDVPIGKAFSLTSGYQKKNNIGRFYIGARMSLGNYYSWGYVSTNFEYGTFIRKSNTEQGNFSVSIDYFTGLIEIGNWKFRQFVKPQVTIGINRFSYDSLTLNDNLGLDGFNSSLLSGTNRLLFTLQTQSYAPWNFIGFRFGPYLIYSLGMLGDDLIGLKSSKVYSQIGLGILIKNENLVLKTFQISIAFYPVIPGRGNNVFKMNSFKTTDFGFRDFEIGKPVTMLFQ